VNQQVAEVDIGIAQIVAEDIFAKMLEEQLAGRRFSIELAALVPGTIKGDIGLSIIGHEATEEWRQESLSVFDQAADHLLGIEGRSLVPEIDIAVDLARLPQNGHVGKAMGIGQSPERRLETDGANRSRQRARWLEIFAIDHRDIGADRSVLRYVAIEAAADLDLDVLRGDVVEKLPG
jgi:hypothetical protein